MKRALLVTLVVAAFLSVGTTASANVIFTLGNDPGNKLTTTNIMFGARDVGTDITGFISGTDIDVLFETLTGQTLKQDAAGQADIFNAAGGYLNSLRITVPGYTFGGMILNPWFGSGIATVTAVDNLNGVFSYTLGNGQNYLTISTEDGQSIKSLEITMTCPAGSSCGFNDLRQPRIAEVSPDAPPIPEPASMLLLGSGLVGLAGYLRRRR